MIYIFLKCYRNKVNLSKYQNKKTINLYKDFTKSIAYNYPIRDMYKIQMKIILIIFILVSLSLSDGVNKQGQIIVNTCTNALMRAMPPMW